MICFIFLSERPGISRAFAECCVEELFGRRFKIEFAETFTAGIHVKFHPKRILSGQAAVNIDREGLRILIDTYRDGKGKIKPIKFDEQIVHLANNTTGGTPGVA